MVLEVEKKGLSPTEIIRRYKIVTKEIKEKKRRLLGVVTEKLLLKLNKRWIS